MENYPYIILNTPSYLEFCEPHNNYNNNNNNNNNNGPTPVGGKCSIQLKEFNYVS